MFLNTSSNNSRKVYQNSKLKSLAELKEDCDILINEHHTINKILVNYINPFEFYENDILEEVASNKSRYQCKYSR